MNEPPVSQHDIAAALVAINAADRFWDRFPSGQFPVKNKAKQKDEQDHGDGQLNLPVLLKARWRFEHHGTPG